MRLIDEEAVTFGGDVKEINGELYIKASDVDKWLKNAPTAYYPDKVVEQLEEEKECGFDMVDIDYAIEIVKKGGVSNETD